MTDSKAPLQWMDRFRDWIEERKEHVKRNFIDASEAQSRLFNGKRTSVRLPASQSSREVSVKPADTFPLPQCGKLVGYDEEKIVLELSEQNNRLRVHFPQLGFVMEDITSAGESNI